MIGIICAMEIEMKKLLEDMTDISEVKHAGVRFVTGKKKDKDTVMAISGVGKVNAAVCTQIMIDLFKPEIILNVGVAGSLTPDLNVTDIVIASQLVQHDMDCTALGFKKGQIYGSGERFFPANQYVVDKLKESIDILNSEKEKKGEKQIHSIFGTIASGDLFVSEDSVKKKIVGEFQAVACEMEGAAVGQVCVANELRFGVVRAISDSANESSKMDYGEFCRQAADTTAEVVNMFMTRV